jgi:kynurenine formamidase
MRVVDLSHTISANMPVYPETEPPVFECPCTIDEHGFCETKIDLFSHTGTHMDAPAHIIAGSQTLDQFPVESFFGSAGIIDVSGVKESRIEIDHVAPYEASIRRWEFAVLCSGWSRFWGEAKYYQGYPLLSVEAAVWLSGFPLKGLGIDMISVDAMGSTDFPVHRVFLEKNILIIENLTNLEKIDGDDFRLACLPLKFEDADGSPVRAVAIME